MWGFLFERTGTLRLSGVCITLAVLGLCPAVDARAQASPAGTGRIEGTATISRRLTNPRQRVRVYSEPGTPPSTPQEPAHPFAGVVISLESTPVLRQVSRPQPAVAMAQRNEQFDPHVVAVVAGSSVEFPNNDPIYHNVFSLSSARSFDLGRYAQGSSKSVRFNTPGVVQVFCHIHADMSGYILVYDHPFFVMPDAQGRFTLDGIPPGEYQLVAWHERVRPVRVTVRVEAGRTSSPTIAIPLIDAPSTP